MNQEGPPAAYFMKHSETEDEEVNVDEDVPQEIIWSVDVANIICCDIEVSRNFVQMDADVLPSPRNDQTQQVKNDNIMTQL